MTNVTTFKRDELQIEYSADPIDQVRAGADREVMVCQFDQQARRIHEIQTVLAKFDKGSYGLCEQCEEPIALKRLDAVPWGRPCIQCQSEAETRGRAHETVFDAAA